MKNPKILFLSFCFTSRLLLAFIAKIIDLKYLPIFGAISFIISMSFFRNYLNQKSNSKGFFDSKVWWNNYRLIHGILYLIFSILAIAKKPYSWIILLVDAIFGLLVFINKYYIVF